MWDMRRLLPGLLATVALTAAAAAPAQASVVELGLPTTRSALVAPSCPPGVSAANCTIILTQVTALATIRDGVAYPTTITQPGYLVAFTLGLSRLDSNDTKARAAVHFLNATYGGTSRAGITVLKPVGPHKNFRWQVVAQSPVVHLQPYLGEVVQFPLQSPIRVLPGEVVALTVPTWAPVLSFDLPLKRYAYRQSRTRNCASPPASSQAQTATGTSARYVCNYPGTRVEYSATEVTDPVPAKHQIH